MEEEKVTSEPVLFTWTDAESGEELCILVQGPPEFLAELQADGFLPVDREVSSPVLEGTTRCTVRVKVAG
jgi:hypothetical protein